MSMVRRLANFAALGAALLLDQPKIVRAQVGDIEIIYHGCYADDADDRIFDNMEQMNDMTIQGCTDHCIGKFASAAGMQNGDQCWCHQTGSTAFGRHGGGESSTGDVVCDDRCDGDMSEFCGGSWAFSLYEIQYPKVDYEVHGCFGDDPNDRIMDEHVVISDYMTNEMCAYECAKRGKAAAGTQNGDECWCHETGVDYFGRHGTSGSSDDNISCDTACAGDHGQDCGGSFAVNLMEIKY
eukprot:g4405.t1